MSKFKNDSKAKRYYWLKLKTDFFDQKEVKLLRRIAGGDTYTIIYLKMLLKSLKNEGKLFYEFYGDNFSEEISLDIDESVEDVGMTIQYLETKGLIELVEEDEYFLNKVPEMIGSESYSAERVRRHRQRKMLRSDDLKLQSNSRVTPCNEEIEQELEQEIDLEKESEIEQEQKQDIEQELDIELDQDIESREQVTASADFANAPPFENNNLLDCLELYENEFGELGRIDKNTLERLGKDYGNEFLYKAIEKAAYRENVKTPLGYITYLLREWNQKGFTSIYDIEDEQEKFNEKYEDDESDDFPF